MSAKGFGLERSRLSAALFAALLMPVAGAAFAQDAAAPQDPNQDQTTTTNKATTLDKVVVTGSLIPQTELETFQPVTIISAEDLQTRGFNQPGIRGNAIARVQNDDVAGHQFLGVDGFLNAVAAHSGNSSRLSSQGIQRASGLPFGRETNDRVYDQDYEDRYCFEHIARSPRDRGSYGQ